MLSFKSVSVRCSAYEAFLSKPNSCHRKEEPSYGNDFKFK